MPVEPNKKNIFNFKSLRKNKPILLKVGTITRPHGVKGDVFVKPFNTHFDWPSSLKELFIESQNFNIESYTPHKNGCIFKLKDVITRDQSESLKGLAVFLNQEDFLKENQTYLFEYLNFTCKVKGQGTVGIIKAFKSTPYQDYLVISGQSDQTHLIPFVKAYLQDIDSKQKTLTLNLPKNFFEIFND